MASLYTRATPSQARILKIVEGACINARDAHPNVQINRRFARSVAKRAAGTLTAQWPDVLAAGALQPSDGAEANPSGADRRGVSHLTRHAVTAQLVKRTKASASYERRRSLRFLHRRIGYLCGQAKRSGDASAHAAFVTALRLIAAELNTPAQIGRRA
jgi:hypothetical protein